MTVDPYNTPKPRRRAGRPPAALVAAPSWPSRTANTPAGAHRPPCCAAGPAGTSSATPLARLRRRRSAISRSIIATSTRALRPIRCSTPSSRRACWNRLGTRADSSTTGGPRGRGDNRGFGRRESLEPLQDVGIHGVAVDIHRNRVATPRQHLQLHGLAPDQPASDLVGAAWIDGPVPLAMQDEHRRADFRKLVPDHRAQTAKLVDARRRAQSLAVQLLDGAGMPQVDVIAGAMPAHHPLDDGKQRWYRPTQPDG